METLGLGKSGEKHSLLWELFLHHMEKQVGRAERRMGSHTPNQLLLSPDQLLNLEEKPEWRQEL